TTARVSTCSADAERGHTRRALAPAGHPPHGGRGKGGAATSADGCSRLREPRTAGGMAGKCHQQHAPAVPSALSNATPAGQCRDAPILCALEPLSARLPNLSL